MSQLSQQREKELLGNFLFVVGVMFIMSVILVVCELTGFSITDYLADKFQHHLK